jgi:hypothetical protein
LEWNADDADWADLREFDPRKSAQSAFYFALHFTAI